MSCLPWNRIAGELCPCLPALGFRGLSTFGPAQVVRRTSGFNVCNCHCDPVSWKRGGAFTGTQKALAQVIAHLRAKRQGTADPGEPTGLLTHHVDMDDATWDFVSDLLRTLTQHPATEVFTAREVFCDAR